MKLFGFNIIVLLCMAALALVLGVANNFRVYKERRVPLFEAFEGK